MTFRFSFIDTPLSISKEYIMCLEIENKNYFYRVVNNLNNYIKQCNNYDELIINENVKLDIIIDYFNLINNNKKNIINVTKYVEKNIDEETHEKIRKNYNKLIKSLNGVFEDIELPIEIKNDFDMDSVLKILNITIKKEDNLLTKLYTYLDFNKLFNKNIIVFVNLKDYLTNNELIELYKYCIYNEIEILMIDNKSYGVSLKYEKKLIVDCSLEEYVV